MDSVDLQEGVTADLGKDGNVIGFEVIDANDTWADAICPFIVSASHATDIPAFFGKWFRNRLEAGHLLWTNPFNAKQVQYVSFQRTRVIVFWSKNPRPLIQYLPDLDATGIHYYFQFTLNDYEDEGLEPLVPPLAERVETFRILSERLGSSRVIWRYDPLILTDKLTVSGLLHRISGVAELLRGCTEKLVISFADISIYKKVQNNLAREHVNYREFSTPLMLEIAEGLQRRNQEWGLKIATCSEGIDLAQYGIEHSRCIDDNLMVDLFKDDSVLMGFLGYQPDLFGGQQRAHLKDRSQRKACGCIVSKDIGMYDTRHHLCRYCYANTSQKSVENNLRKHNPRAESLIPQSAK